MQHVWMCDSQGAKSCRRLPTRGRNGFGSTRRNVKDLGRVRFECKMVLYSNVACPNLLYCALLHGAPSHRQRLDTRCSWARGARVRGCSETVPGRGQPVVNIHCYCADVPSRQHNLASTIYIRLCTFDASIQIRRNRRPRSPLLRASLCIAVFGSLMRWGAPRCVGMRRWFGPAWQQRQCTFLLAYLVG
jgi:hypothetical protein